MAIAVNCNCGRKFRAKDEHLGKYGRCPGCGERITIAGERLPNHDVFVSYSSKDKQIADAVCASLESDRVRCWIAPRDIRPGMDWGGAIIDAIADSRVLVLLYTEHSNQSPQVLREVERAVSKGVVIVPMRLVDVPPTKGMEYFISASHWMDALSGADEQNLQLLVRQVKGLLAAGAAGDITPISQSSAPGSAQPPRQSRLRRVTVILWSLAALVTLVVVPLVGVSVLRSQRSNAPATDGPTAASPPPEVSAATTRATQDERTDVSIAVGTDRDASPTTPTTKSAESEIVNPIAETRPTTRADSDASLAAKTDDAKPPSTRPTAAVDSSRTADAVDAAPATAPKPAPLQAGALRPIESLSSRGGIPDLQGGAAISRLALVPAPARLRGGASAPVSWTVETRHHRGSIYAAEYSPDGALLATAGDDGAVRVWSGGNKKLVKVLLGHDGSVICLKWVPKGGRSILATGGMDGRVQVWEVQSGKSTRVYEGKDPHDIVTALDWAPDGKQLVFGTQAGLVGIVNAFNAREVRRQSMGFVVGAVAWSPNGKVIAVGDYQEAPSDIRMLNAANGGTPAVLRGHTFGVTSLCWRSDGQQLASADGQGGVHVWNAASAKPEQTLRPEFRARAYKVAWAPDDKTLAIGLGGSLYVWKPGLEKERKVPGSFGSVPAWSPDGATLAFGRPDGNLEFWQSSPWQQPPPSANGMAITVGEAWSADRSLLAISVGRRSDRAQVRLLDVRNGRLLRQFDWPSAWEALLSLSADGRRLSSSEGASLVHVINLQTTTEDAPINVTPALFGCSPAWSPTAKDSVAIAHTDNVVRIWNASTGLMQHALVRAGGKIEGGSPLAWSPDGKVLAVSEVGGISLWSDAGQLLGTITHTDSFERVDRIRWSPDGTLLAGGGSASGRPQTRVWDGQGRVVSKIDSLSKLEDWSPDGKHLLLGDGRPLAIFAAATGMLEKQVEFAPVSYATLGGITARWLGQNTAALRSPDAVVRLCDLNSGKITGTIVAGLLPSGAAAIDADGHLSFDGDQKELADHLVYVVLTRKGQETLSPTEFADRFGWRNNPDHVELVPPAGRSAGGKREESSAKTPKP